MTTAAYEYIDGPTTISLYDETGSNVIVSKESDRQYVPDAKQVDYMPVDFWRMEALALAKEYGFEPAEGADWEDITTGDAIELVAIEN